MPFRGPSLTALWADGQSPSFAPPVSELAQLKWSRRFPNYYGPMVSITTADWHYISGGSYGVQLFRCCDQNIETMDLAQTVLGGPVMQQLSAGLAAEGASDPLRPVPPREFRFAAVSPPEALAVADFNGDGNPDIAVAGQNGSRTLLLGDGTGRFARSMSRVPNDIPLQRAGLKANGDLNGNGLEDLALADPVNRTVKFVLRHADGEVTTCTLRLDVSPDFIAMADVNHNGSSDLVIASRENASITVLLSGTASGAESAAAARR
jgi:hypothetical protein